MKHLGDITKLKGNDVPPVEIITGGSPCQDLSTAGKRAGLQGERSGLFIEQIRLIKEMRENDKACGRTDKYIRPRFMVWENVPGAFSSNQGEDFRIVLEETARVADPDAVIPEPPKGKWQPAGCILGDGWSIAWRVHDAQFWGVPQRRKRISLVADFAGGGAPEILFEREGVPGDTDPSEQTREAIARDPAESTGIPSAYTLKIRGGVERDSSGRQAGKGPLIQTDLSATLGAVQDQTLFCCDQAAGKSSVSISENISPTLATTHDGAPVVTIPNQDKQAIVYGISSNDSNSMKSPNPHSGVYEAETARCLDNNGGSPACNQGGMAVCEPAISIEGNGNRPSHKGDGYSESGKMYTLNTIEHHGVAYRKTARPQNAEQGQGWEETDVHDTLNSFDSSEARTPTVVVGFPLGFRAENTRTYDEKATTVCNGTRPGFTCGVVQGFDANNPALAVESHAQDARYNVGDINQPLSANMDHDPANGGLVLAIENHPNDSRVKISDDGKVQTLSSRMGTGGNNVPLLMEQCSLDGSQVAPTLSSSNANGAQRMPDKDNFNAVLTYGLDRASFNQGKNAKFTPSVDEALSASLTAKGPNACAQPKDVDYVVRRLTPTECERLQGFNDGWTDIGDWVDSKGKMHKSADSPRYKALGNSIALPFWQWMAQRMAAFLRADGVDEPTMASLFDGIGGFPLVYQRAGCKPVWASEVEEFTIAVTKVRFPEEN